MATSYTKEGYLLSESQVQEVSKVIAPRLLEQTATLKFEQLAKYGINVITGLEFLQKQRRVKRSAGYTRAYKRGYNRGGKLMDIDEVDLKVEVCRAHFVDHVENYREYDEWHILAENNFADVNSAQKMLYAGQSTTEDLVTNVYWGWRDNTVVDEEKKLTGKYGVLSNFDGLFKHISDLKAAGNKVHVIETGEFQPVTGSTTDANWNIFVSFIEQLPSSFQKIINAEDNPQNATVRVNVTPQTYARILNSYTRTYPALTPDKVSKVEVSFMDFPNVILVSNFLIGKGSMMYAVIDVPGESEFDYGVDSLNNANKVEVNKNPFEPDEYMYDIKIACGTRVMDLDHVVFNDCENTFTASDYIGGEIDEDNDCTMAFSVEKGLYKVEASEEPAPNPNPGAGTDEP